MLTACGGSDQGRDVREGGAVTLPTPVEDADSAAAKLISAARSGDCRRVAPHIFSEGLAVCRDLKEAGALESVALWDGSLKRFGTAALGEVTQVDGTTASIVLALNPERRFKFVTITEQFGDPLPEGWAAPKVKDGLAALRDDDCEAFYRFSSQLAGAQTFCEFSWVRDFQASVTAADRLSEQSLGGNGYVSFFAVTADRSVYTVTLISDGGNFHWASAAPAT